MATGTGILTFVGQSNMVGYRSDPSLVWPLDGEDYFIPYSHNNAANRPAVGSYYELQPILKADGGGTGFTDPEITVPPGYSSYGFGPEITCARAMNSFGRRVSVVKESLGGKTLDEFFNPQPEGAGWTELFLYLNGHYSALETELRDPYHLALVYWQGESDADNASTADAYERNLRRFITFFRAAVKRPELPVVICKTLTDASGATGTAPLQTVQDAQENVERTVPNVKLYDPTGLPVYSDGIHFWKGAHVTSGNAIAGILQEFGI